MTGRLVLVVGPSGAGKDSVLRGAAQALKGDPRFMFPRRIITRQADNNSEDHDTINQKDFEIAAAEGYYMLHWNAHGNFYGITVAVEKDIKLGRVACINVSRGV